MEQSTQDVMEQPMTSSPVGEQQAVITTPLPAVAFTKVDNNLTGIGFFTASSKRSRKAIEKTTVVIDQGIEHKISILPSAKYGLPITQDQDYWLALMKLVTEHLQREGKIVNPFTFTTAQLQHILGQSDAGKNYKAVDEWLSVMKSTTIEGGAYNAARKSWLRDKTGAIDRVVTVGKELENGAIAEKNYIWFSQWQLDNINAGNLIPIELATYTQLQNNIAKNLVPHLQEWLYASQRDGRFEKQYEDICQLLGIRVYRYRSQIAEQLSPSLDELVSHYYVSKWAIEPMANNRKTYKLILWHGSKYHSDRQARIEGKQRAQLTAPAGDSSAPIHRPRQRRLNLKPAVPEPPQQPAAPATIIDYRLVAELSKRGISETDSRAILASLPPGQAVLDQLEWADLQISQARGKITNPAGFYISFLQRNVTPPPTFETSAVRNARQAAELAHQQAIQQQTEAQLAAEAAAETDLAQFQVTEPDQYQTLYRQAQAQLFTDHPKLADLARAHPNSSLHDGAIRARMKQLRSQETQPQPTQPTSPEIPHQTTNSPIRQASRLQEMTPEETTFAATLQAILIRPQLRAPIVLPGPSDPQKQ